MSFRISGEIDKLLLTALNKGEVRKQGCTMVATFTIALIDRCIVKKIRRILQRKTSEYASASDRIQTSGAAVPFKYTPE